MGGFQGADAGCLWSGMVLADSDWILADGCLQNRTSKMSANGTAWKQPDAGGLI